MTKYVYYKNPGGCGFGNQIRSFFGAHTLAKFTGRELIIDDTYMINAFECDESWNRGLSIQGKSMKLFTPSVSNARTKPLIPVACNDNLSMFSEEVLLCGDGTDMGGWYLIENPHYKAVYESILESFGGDRYYDYLVNEFSLTPSAKFEELAKKVIDYDKEEYINIQFRAFYDDGNRYLGLLEDFVEKFKEVVKEKGLQDMKVFLTTDSASATNYIKEQLPDFDIFESVYPMKHSQVFDLKSIVDWLIVGKSKFSFNTGTSFATTAGIIFNTDMYLFDGSIDGYIRDVFYQI